MACERCNKTRSALWNFWIRISGQRLIYRRWKVNTQELATAKMHIDALILRVGELDQKYLAALEAGALLEERIATLERQHITVGGHTSHKVQALSQDLDYPGPV